MKFDFSFPTGAFTKAMQNSETVIAAAATGAVRDAAALAQSAARQNMGAAGFSGRWQNALRVKNFPARGVSLKPASLVYSKIPYSGIFETGGKITAATGGMLWLPLSNAPIVGGKRLTPEGFARATGGLPLYTINRPGKAPLLAAVVRQVKGRQDKGVSLAQLRRGRNPGGRGAVVLVPLFVGVEQVNIPKKFEINALVKRAADLLPTLYLKNLKT